MDFQDPHRPTLSECDAIMERNGGSLYLIGTAITALAEGLSVGGSLDLIGTAITALAEGLSVGGSLDLIGTAITALPEGLSVGGSLYLSGTASELSEYMDAMSRHFRSDGINLTDPEARKYEGAI